MPTEEPIAAEREASPGIPELMDEDDVCALLSISPATAYRLRRSRKLGFCRYGVRIKYLRRHVEAFLDAHEVPAEQDAKGETRLRAVG